MAEHRVRNCTPLSREWRTHAGAHQCALDVVGLWAGHSSVGQGLVKSGVTPGCLEIASLVACDQAKDPGENNGSQDGDEDGIDHASLTREAYGPHEEAADDGSDDADDDIHEGAVAATLHELAGDEAGDESDDDPPEDAEHAKSPFGTGLDGVWLKGQVETGP